jgi:hypothetical protein
MRFHFQFWGYAPVGYANSRKGAPSRKLLLFLMRFAGVFSGGHHDRAFVASASVASPIGRAKASLCRRRAENGSPALGLLKRCTDVFDELAEFGETVRGGDLWLLENLCGFRVLVVLGGLYGSACNQACESNKADGHHMMATPPLMHRKGHAGPRDQ